MRCSLGLLLAGEEGIEVIADTDDLASAMRHVQDGRPHVLALDRGMPDGSTSLAIAELREQAPHTAIVILTMDENPVFAQQALACGALGFVLKDRADSELAPAIRAASNGKEYVSPRVAGRLTALRRSLNRE